MAVVFFKDYGLDETCLLGHSITKLTISIDWCLLLFIPFYQDFNQKVSTYNSYVGAQIKLKPFFNKILISQSLIIWVSFGKVVVQCYASSNLLFCGSVNQIVGSVVNSVYWALFAW